MEDFIKIDDNFNEIFQEKSKLGKYLKEKCYSGNYQNLTNIW